MRLLIILFSLLAFTSAAAQTWVDTLDNFARTVYLPPNQFFWRWQDAPLLHAMEFQYEIMPEEEQQKYLTYVKRAMDRNILIANGTSPNALASANGMAFLYRITGEDIYKIISERVYYEFVNIMRTSNGGVSHLTWTPELWDDTIYMIGVYLLGMYRATGDERYIDDLVEQIIAHREKLLDEEWGLWVHGWDGDNEFDFDFCSQMNWADTVTRRSQELWGRGNGWVVVTLSEMLNTLDENHPHRDFTAATLEEMISRLPDIQDPENGHWYQLPARIGEEGNFMESSCTAMFGFGILTALKHDVVSGDEFETAVELAYHGLRNHSVMPIEVQGEAYYTTINVGGETCIGDKQYYFDRTITNGTAYALAMDIIFGRAYEMMDADSVATGLIPNVGIISDFQIYPTLLTGQTTLQLRINSTKDIPIEIQVIDMMGRAVYQTTAGILSGENHRAVSINELARGSYFLTLKNRNRRIHKSIPFVVQ